MCEYREINTDSYPLGIDGNINFDYLNSQYAGELHIDRDEHSYDPRKLQSLTNCPHCQPDQKDKCQ